MWGKKRSTEPPLAPARLFLKQITSSDTDPHRTAIFNLAFPLFFRLTNRFLDQSQDLPPLITGRGSKVYYVHRGRERRFAGDGSLGRGRYYAVCSQTDAGLWSDHGTLLGELRSYHSYAGRCLVAIGDSQLDEAEAQAHANMDLEGPRAALPPHMANGAFLAVTVRPVVPTAKTSDVGLNGSEWCGSIMPYTLQVSEFEKVLDLRTREALEWVRTEFFNLYEGIAKRQREAGDRTIIVQSRRPESDAELLNVLVAPELGGGQPFNQALGYLMRKYACDGIIFPSARVDFSATSGKDGVEHSKGWNFVRLRGEAYAGDEVLAGIIGRSWLQKVHTGYKTTIAADSKAGKFEIRASGFLERNIARFEAMQCAVRETGEPSFGDEGKQLISAMDLEPAGPLYVHEFADILQVRFKAELDQIEAAARSPGAAPLHANPPWMGIISQDYLRYAGRLPPGNTTDFLARIVDNCL